MGCGAGPRVSGRTSHRAGGGEDPGGSRVSGLRADAGGEVSGQPAQHRASRETVRQWMMRAGLWRGRRAKLSDVHVWRPRRSRCGERVQWDTSEHDWLEGRGERLYLIAMMDDATSRLFARFARHD